MLESDREIFSPQWRAFTREAAISGQSISAGLTALRAANYAATGLYSHAFFSLSIGFERLLKLIFLIDHAILHDGDYPTDDVLRNNFGHDLDKLFQYAVSVHKRMPNQHHRYPLDPRGLEIDALRFLAKFAKRTRYYNLDFLVGAKSALADADPIREWYSSIGMKILDAHYTKAQRIKDEHAARVIEAMAGSFSLVHYTAEDGSPITSLEAGALQTGQNKVVQKYGTFYCVKIARFLFMILYDLVHEAHRHEIVVPYLYELFFPFMNDDAYLLGRKTFPPRGQGR